MANSITYNKISFKVGDTITVNYKIKEGEKFRTQPFKGILIRIKGSNDVNRMITVRKISNTGIGIERIFPLASSNIDSIKLDKKSNYQKAKAYFIRDLNDSEIRRKLYRQK